MLQRADAQPVDPRFSAFIATKRSQGRDAVRAYLAGDVLAEHWIGDFGSAITNSARAVALRRDWEPAGSGLWMGYPEKEWGLSASHWARLPRAEQAALEVREQVTRYVPDQFGLDWLETYHPELVDAEWWGGGSRVAFDDQPAYMRAMSALAARVRGGTGLTRRSGRSRYRRR